jgi:hypothetical protein
MGLQQVGPTIPAHRRDFDIKVACDNNREIQEEQEGSEANRLSVREMTELNIVLRVR